VALPPEQLGMLDDVQMRVASADEHRPHEEFLRLRPEIKPIVTT
jgi:hypothetical protein